MSDEASAPVVVEEAAPAAVEAEPAAEAAAAEAKPEAMEVDAAPAAEPKAKGKAAKAPKKPKAEKKAPAAKKAVIKKSTGGLAPAAEKKPAAAKAAASPKAAKKPAAKSTATHSHPPYLEMAVAAIEALKERTGSSRQAILKYILATYDVGGDSKVANVHLKQALKRGVLNETLKNTKVRRCSYSSHFSCRFVFLL